MKVYNQITAPFGAKRPNSSSCIILSGSRTIYISLYLADRMKIAEGQRIGISESNTGELYITTQDVEGWQLCVDNKKRTNYRLRVYSSFLNTFLRDKLSFGKSATVYIPVSSKPEKIQSEGVELTIFPLLISGAYTPTKRGV